MKNRNLLALVATLTLSACDDRTLYDIPDCGTYKGTLPIYEKEVPVTYNIRSYGYYANTHFKCFLTIPGKTGGWIEIQDYRCNDKVDSLFVDTPEKYDFLMREDIDSTEAKFYDGLVIKAKNTIAKPGNKVSDY